MFKWLRDWYENKRIKKMGFTVNEWEAAVADWPVLARYQGADRQRLREMALRFVVRKNITSGGDFKINDGISLKIATMACVPILNLGLDWYDNFYTIIVYEGDFIPNHSHRSDDGIVHDESPGLSGEAWLRGPLILSWQSVNQSGAHVRHGKAGNVVIHEFAHKLDMLRDGANGAPPMHPSMQPGEWHDIFSAAWHRLQNDLQHHQPLPLDGYSLTSPAEFFAVCSETFFEDPVSMKEHMPEVYRLLSQFYRQQP